MPDIVDQATRSRMMAGIGSRNTKPELVLRQALHARGPQIPPAQSEAPRHARPRLSSIRSRLLRARLLLAQACRVPLRDHPNHAGGVLAGQVRSERRPRPEEPSRAARGGLAGGSRLGMRTAKGGRGRNGIETGALASREQSGVRDKSRCRGCCRDRLSQVRGPLSRPQRARAPSEYTGTMS